MEKELDGALVRIQDLEDQLSMLIDYLAEREILEAISPGQVYPDGTEVRPN